MDYLPEFSENRVQWAILEVNPKRNKDNLMNKLGLEDDAAFDKFVERKLEMTSLF